MKATLPTIMILRIPFRNSTTERMEKSRWKPAKGDIGLNTVAVQSLANTLATLRAVQWVGATKPGQGLDRPAVTVAFTAADKTANTVKTGGTSGDYWNANATGWTGTFEMSRPDHDTFTADFLQSATVSSMAATSSPDLFRRASQPCVCEALPSCTVPCVRIWNVVPASACSCVRSAVRARLNTSSP